MTSITSQSNFHPQKNLSTGSLNKTNNLLTQSELSQELTNRMNEVSTIAMGKLLKFVKIHRKELAIFAIKRPSNWLLFSQCMLQKFHTDCRIARLLKKLNHFIKDKDRSQCNKAIQHYFTDGTFNQVFPKELWQQIALNIPPSYHDNSVSLEKIRLILLEDKPPPSDCFSEIKSIPISDLVNWISTYQVPLQTLKISKEKLNLLLPKLEYVDLSGFSKEKIPNMIMKLKKVRHLSCNQMTNEDLTTMSIFKRLTSLYMSNSKEITDEGLKDLTFLSDLTTLNISYCDQITDEGIATITVFTNLKRLEIKGCNKVTDEGLENLAILTELRDLDISDCNITDEGRQNLQDQLPLLNIHFKRAGKLAAQL